MNEKLPVTEAHSGDCVSRAEALALLGVKPETLYSYVSRGLIRRVAVEDGRSLYARFDVERMRARSIARSGHGPAAGAAVHWGEPILETRLTQITLDGPVYRGVLATDLARAGRPFIEVARYLWSGDWTGARPGAEIDPDLGRRLGHLLKGRRTLHIRHVMAQAVLLLASQQSDGCEPADVASDRLLCTLAGCLGFFGTSRAFLPVAPETALGDAALHALGGQRAPALVSAVEAILVLCADHDLTPATFAGRIAASVGADLHACIGAALNAQFGTEFGLGFDRVELLLRNGSANACELPQSEQSIRYHHPLYPNGDPRARLIVDLVMSLKGLSEPACHAIAQLRANSSRTSPDLTIEEALAVFAIALGLPPQSAGALFTLGRAAGWLAHAREQQESHFIIRPRAQFVPGSRPSSAGVH
jgi:citrate synthase